MKEAQTMDEHHGIPRSDLKIVRALGQQFDRLAERESRNRRGWHAARRRPAAALAFVGGLLAAAGAGAATGVLPVGSVFRGEGFDHRQGATDKTMTGADETIVATGTAPVAGRWQLTVFKSSETKTAEGEVLEPAGLTCLKLRLLDPQGQRFGGGGFCGDTSEFTATFRTSVDATQPGEVLVFGWAPEQATAVELTADRGQTLKANLHGPANVSGDYFLIAAPPGLKNARMSWIGPDGDTRPGRDLSNAFEDPLKRGPQEQAPE
jgi:hypothetical protein